MAKNDNLTDFLVDVADAIRAKTGTTAKINPQDFSSKIKAIEAGSGGSSDSKIICAELPNTTIKLYNSSDTLIDTKTTDSNVGGAVEFNDVKNGTYTIQAYQDNTLIWTNSIEITKSDAHNVKVGKALNDYSWDEINTASINSYAQYMWSTGDYKYLSSVMGSTSTKYTKAEIIGFNHDDLADNTGKAGITFKIAQFGSSTYKHRSASGSNGISWVGSLIRQNALKSGESYYLYDDTVTSSTSGTYYKYNGETDAFDEVTLPGAFDSNTKYYAKTTLSADGAFIAGLPTDLAPYIKQVTKKTWTGYIGTSSNTNETIIKTKDWLFLLSDGEVFGNDMRCWNHSKYTQEGLQYEYFKTYSEIFRCNNKYSGWLRSPYVSSSYYFCSWNYNGSVTSNSAHYTYYVPLCFCI